MINGTCCITVSLVSLYGVEKFTFVDYFGDMSNARDYIGNLPMDLL